MEEIKKYTKEDFLNSLEPFEFVYSFKDNGFKQERMIDQISVMAQKEGVRNFKKLFAEYVKLQKHQSKVSSDNVTQFEGQEFELDCGDWKADDFGITTEGMFGEITACCHPIMPVERLVNIDTGIEKLKVAYRKGRNWKFVISDRKTLASNNAIVSLADYGIAVNSENSKHLVKYLHDVENLNFEYILERSSVSRLGWIDGEGFSPYVESLVFDGDANFRTFFESVSQKGSLDKWTETVKKVRNFNIATKIILASSFASVLVGPLKSLPFIVHLWGSTEAGKTVGLMLAASVWANPEVGKYIQSFNSTAVGRERAAAFVNNLPLIMDELELVKDKKQFDQDIYMLCEGTGKSRGNKHGGMDKTPTWANCILTSGERPLVNGLSGGGAVNRIVEIACEDTLFQNPQEFCATINRNYGHAGKAFVDYVKEEFALAEIKSIFKKYLSELSESDTTQKQAMAGALILTADEIASRLFFDNESLKVKEIVTFMKSKSEVSVCKRGYEFFCDWVSQNANYFSLTKEVGETYGMITGSKAYIIKSVFDRVCNDNGFSSHALLTEFKKVGLIEVSQAQNTVTKRIHGNVTRCVALNLLEDDGIL